MISARFTISLAAVAAVSLAGCPGSGSGEDTGTTAASTSAASPTTGGAESGTLAPGSSTGTTADTSSTGATADTSSTGAADGTTTGDGTTGDGDSTAGPVDPSCTYPGSTSDGPVSPDLAPECACIGDEGVLLCQDNICPPITGTCDPAFSIDHEGCHGMWSYDAGALDCAITAARDGTEGTLRWGFPAGDLASRHGFLHILPGRRVIRQATESVDYDHDVSDTEIWQLRDPQYFQGCLELPTYCMRLHCFFGGTDGSSLSLCLPAFYYSDF